MKAKFQAGDIIIGTEGDGKTWANTTTLLVVHAKNAEDVLGIVLRSLDREGKDNGRNGDCGPWCLTCRDWKKIGVVPSLVATRVPVAHVVESYATPTETTR